MTEIWNGTYREPEYWDYFAQRLVELVGIGAGARVLDVGTGWKGAILFPTAEAAGKQGQVIGIDRSEPSLKETAAMIKERGLNNAKTVEMDATSMDFEDNSFDVVFSGFTGWRSVFDFTRCEYTARDRKIEEIFRVLKAGGRVGISSWALQEDNEWMGELLNWRLAAAGQDTRQHYSKETAAGLEKILRSAGFRDVTVLTEEKEFVYRDEGEWLAVMDDYGWHSDLETFKNLLPDEQRAFERDAFEKFSQRKQADGIHYTRIVLFALGTK